ncbi:hypothetical protein LEP1GSC019_3446 [Leptospira interrogans serovar Pyrogenes str. 2006006960]|nr:hypothetical protein LEP1GSC019_3446 [Leptospira interrogans serovar Pyrogenes str. 2006006960]
MIYLFLMKFGLLEYLKLKVVCDSFQVLEKQKGAFMNSMLRIKRWDWIDFKS